MDKRPSFESDLNAITHEVDASIEGMVQALNEKKPPASKVQKIKRDNNMTDIDNQPNKEAVQGKNSRGRETKPSLLSESAVLVNVTTRLSRETNELLTEVSLHQRLKRATPNTRQDVIEVALREWYKRNGYG